MTTEQNRGQAETETAKAGEGRWTQGSGQVDPGATAEGVQPGEKGHRDGTVEERADQVGGPGGVQREREELGSYDPGRVGLEPGDEANPSDPADYPNPDDQRAGTSRTEPGLADQ